MVALKRSRQNPSATEPVHPSANDTTTSKFATLNLQFGRNYDPKSK